MTQGNINAKPNTLLSIIFMMDPKGMIYQRQVFTLFDALALIGGLLKITFITIKILNNLFASNHVDLKIIKKFYA